jgi:hypothetical protein
MMAGRKQRFRRGSFIPRIVAVIVISLAIAACARVAERPADGAGTPGQYEFEGTWNAVGTRRAIPTGDGRTSAIVDLKGTMLLAGPGRPGVGFLCEVIALVDTASGLTGRGVWTDERGDQVFSEVSGQGTAANNRIDGRVVGGTGRYAGATGTYAFSWEYVVEESDGTIQGRAVGLKGSVTLGAPGAEAKP